MFKVMNCLLQGNWLSSPKDTIFPETIPEESSSTEEEHVVSAVKCVHGD
jgi:hypothetical protein